MINIDLEEMEAWLKYLDHAAGSDFLKYLMRKKWSLAVDFQIQGDL